MILRHMSRPIFIAILALSSGMAFAGEAKKTKGKGKAAPKPAAAATTAPASAHGGGSYGMAGCGLGAVVIADKDSRFLQLGASTLNGTSGNQTFGITLGTLNCVESRTEVAAMEQEVFMKANFASLSREAAQGEGEHLKGLAEVFGCSAHEGASELARLSQDHYDVLFNQQEPAAVVGNYIREINANKNLASDCKRAS